MVDTPSNRVPRLNVPPPLLFVAGGCSMYLGAALAVVLFWSVPDFIDTDLGCQVG